MPPPDDFGDRRWPAEAREIATAVHATGLAAQRQDHDGFDKALEEAATLDSDKVALVLGSVVQMLLEETHPDGFGADDLGTLLETCVRSAATWTAEPDIDLLAFVVGGALGMQEPGEEPPSADNRGVTSHAALLATDLLKTTGRPLTDYLDTAIGEIARDQTMEMP